MSIDDNQLLSMFMWNRLQYWWNQWKWRVWKVARNIRWSCAINVTGVFLRKKPKIDLICYWIKRVNDWKINTQRNNLLEFDRRWNSKRTWKLSNRLLVATVIMCTLDRFIRLHTHTWNVYECVSMWRQNKFEYRSSSTYLVAAYWTICVCVFTLY